MKLNLLKKILSVVLSSFFLLIFNSVPANATYSQIDYPCGTSGAFTVENNVVISDELGGLCSGSVNIPSGVTSIATDAFRGNLSITSVVIPDTVLTISASAFQGANGITSLTIGNGITTIGNYAFSGVNKITSLNIPNSVTTIGTSAFSGTSLLASLTLGNQLTTIGFDAFASSALTSLIIPDSVITIGETAFARVPLTSLTLGNSVTTIDRNAFENTRLTTLNIPSSVTTISRNAFTGVTTLSSVTFSGNAPASVDDAAFAIINPPATANVAYNATGFPANGSIWKRLSVVYGSAPSNDSGSTTASVTTPTMVKTADVVFNLKNKKYLSKDAMKTKLSKNKSFKKNPEDLYKYSIFGTSKKSCLMRGNYVTSLKKTGTCDLYATRTTTKGVKYRYWVRINYTK